MTGSYSNFFQIFDCTSKNPTVTLQADKSAFKIKAVNLANPSRVQSAKTKLLNRGSSQTNNSAQKSKKEEQMLQVEHLDFSKKILHSAWHPFENSIAVAATNNLFIFSQL
jgi:serine/threonine-protein phosphatase 2A regulatory subunit B